MEFDIKKAKLDHYIALVGSIFNVTERESVVITTFIKVAKDHKEHNMFSTFMRKKVAEELRVDMYYVANYIRLLKKKNVILNKDGELSFTPLFKITSLPKQLIINFK